MGEKGLYRSCDFCNSKAKETEWFYYYSTSYRRKIKVCLCKECSKNESNLMGRVEEGKIKWKPEST